MVGELTEGDAFALLTDLRNGLRNDGYALEVVTTGPPVALVIRALDGACDDCLVGKSLMTTYVVNALRDASPEIGPEDIDLRYPNELGAAT